MRRRLLTAVVMVMGLGACAERPVLWANAEVSGERAGTDLAACRRWADDRLDPGRVAEETADSPLRAAERSQARGRLDALVAACMRSKGYRPKAR